MFFQLGSIVFDGVLSPNTFGIDGDEATYAEHALIGGKPRLQKTGDSLQILTFEIMFHAEYCNPDAQIKAIKAAKDAGTILSLLMGNGQYIADYVIISYPYTIDQTFADGTTIQATVTLTVKEYISYDKLELKNLEARKAAFAIGPKNPVVKLPAQPEDISKTISRNVTATTQQTTKVDGLVSDFQNNVSQQAVIAAKIKNACTAAQSNINTLNTELDSAEAVQNKFQLIRASANNVASNLTAVKNLYPFTSVSDLKTANTFLQSAVGSFQSTSAPLLENVAVRQPI